MNWVSTGVRMKHRRSGLACRLNTRGCSAQNGRLRSSRRSPPRKTRSSTQQTSNSAASPPRIAGLLISTGKRRIRRCGLNRNTPSTPNRRATRQLAQRSSRRKRRHSGGAIATSKTSFGTTPRFNGSTPRATHQMPAESSSNSTGCEWPDVTGPMAQRSRPRLGHARRM